MEWYYLISIIILFIVLRFLNNFYKYRRIITLYNKYKNYISTGTIDFLEYKEEIKSLFKDAGLKDFGVLHQEFLGFGKFSNMTVSGMDNMTNKREDIVNIIQSRFYEAKGVFKKRYKDSYNPFFWIDFFVKLPQYLFEFFGVLPEKLVVKIFLLIYWLIMIFLGVTNTELLKLLGF